MTGYRGSFEDAARELAEDVEDSVAMNVGIGRRTAVAFSGGLDSSVLVACAMRHAPVFACTAYAAGSADEENSSKAARALRVELVTTSLTREMVSSELREIALPFEPSPMDRSLWCLYSLVSRRAAEAGADAILLGQLADELFGGYAKYQRTVEDEGDARAELLMKADLEEYWRTGIVRDTRACARWLEPRFPFAEKKVLDFGLSLPVAFKLRNGVRKAVLREAAAVLGVPQELADARKKAAQYSSGIQKIMR